MPIAQTISSWRPNSSDVPTRAGASIFVWTTDIDYQSINQLQNVAALPFVHNHVAVMPDVHLGIGGHHRFGDPHVQSNCAGCRWRRYWLFPS